MPRDKNSTYRQGLAPLLSAVIAGGRESETHDPAITITASAETSTEHQLRVYGGDIY